MTTPTQSDAEIVERTAMAIEHAYDTEDALEWSLKAALAALAVARPAIERAALERAAKSVMAFGVRHYSADEVASRILALIPSKETK